jgi:hypothetical protein
LTESVFDIAILYQIMSYDSTSKCRVGPWLLYGLLRFFSGIASTEEIKELQIEMETSCRSTLLIGPHEGLQESIGPRGKNRSTLPKGLTSVIIICNMKTDSNLRIRLV